MEIKDMMMACVFVLRSMNNTNLYKYVEEK